MINKLEINQRNMNTTKKRTALSALLIAGVTLFSSFVLYVNDHHGHINFTAKNDKHAVEGSFEEWKVTSFSITGEDVTTVKANIEVETSSIKVENAKLNNHLKAPDFFDVEQFPKATIAIDGATKAGDKYTTTAKLTVKGKESDVALTFEVVSMSPFKVKGTGVFNRNNHGIGEPTGYYNLLPEVTIDFEAKLN